jgi:DNA-binding transcriptional MerR regulator
MATPARDFRSIGEVLSDLKPDFPDVTISKIRFLESEGLIAPERTASGYRKFYQDDVDRLRRILRLQRDEYLPLKVIRKRLAQDGDGPAPATVTATATATAPTSGVPSADAEVHDADEDIAPTDQPLQMTVDEVSSSTGVPQDVVEQLISFGLLHPKQMGEERVFGTDDVEVLRIVADFFKYGVEARHLTMYRHFADREAAFLQTIIMPLMRQRNPDARRAATRSLSELASVSRRLKQALLRANLRRALGS